MTTTESIVARLDALPPAAQQEVLHFVEFLQSHLHEQAAREDHIAWTRASLASAMRGMEAEETPYVEADLKETYR